MERYLYIFIISIFFLCMCLVCNGCMKIYDRFSVGNDVSSGINISQKLALTYDPSCKPVPPPNPCLPNPCQNGGLCSGNGICTCTGGYTGQHCEINPVMYNCCKTTYTCEEHEDGIYDIAKCSASCIKQSSELDINYQPDSTVQIINNTTEPWLHIFLEYSNDDSIPSGENACRKTQTESGEANPVNLPEPSNKWIVILDKSISDNSLYSLSDPSTKIDMQFSDLGTGSSWQKLSLKNGAFVTLNIPNFLKNCPFRISPIKSLNNSENPDGSINKREWCNYNALYDENQPIEQRDDCGQNIKIEMGKGIGANMSAVDGVNFKLKAEFSDVTTKDTNKYMTTYFQKNPCDSKNCITRNGIETCGCINPAKLITMGPIYNKKDIPGSTPGVNCIDSANCNGPKKMFPYGKGPGNIKTDDIGSPCYHGTCNLHNKFKTWADDIHNGQCAKSETTYLNEDIADTCGEGKGYTTYSYDYDDANSLAYFGSPYKMKLTYYDLN